MDMMSVMWQFGVLAAVIKRIDATLYTVLVDILDGDAGNGLRHHPAAGFVHIVPDPCRDDDGQDQVQNFPQMLIVIHPLHLRSSCPSAVPPG